MSIHPFADGNGRLHRDLIHHVLAKRGFNSPVWCFPFPGNPRSHRRLSPDAGKLFQTLAPVYPVGNNRQRKYARSQRYCRLRSFFDATLHAESLYECAARTIDTYFPAEAQYLKAYDTFKRSVAEIVDMPANTFDLLFRFLRQNKGALSKRGREKEFASRRTKRSRSLKNILQVHSSNRCRGNCLTPWSGLSMKKPPACMRSGSGEILSD